jgi:alginate O-acetyltransferase complex protein AlgI
MITMMLGGLWHGANWPYVVFGILQGGLLIGHRAFRTFCQQRPRLNQVLQTTPGMALRISVTFVIFCLTLVVFRSPTLRAGEVMLMEMLVPHAGQQIHLQWFWETLVLVAVCHGLVQWGNWPKLFSALPSWVRGLGYAAMLSCTLLLATPALKAFIYFQF